jgi:hypothetical protein
MILPVLFALGLGAPAFGATIYDCTFPEGSGGGWTAGRVVVAHDPGEAEATVNAGVIVHFVGSPIKARVVKESDAQLYLSFELKIVDSAKPYTRMGFKLNILQGGARATFSAQPLSYDNTWRSEGKCKKGKG